MFINDVRVRVEKAHSYYYPDLLVSCARGTQAIDLSAVTAVDPVLVLEVLSTSTEATDRREKLYESVPIEALMRGPGQPQLAARVYSSHASRRTAHGVQRSMREVAIRAGAHGASTDCCCRAPAPVRDDSRSSGWIEGADIGRLENGSQRTFGRHRVLANKVLAAVHQAAGVTPSAEAEGKWCFILRALLGSFDDQNPKRTYFACHAHHQHQLAEL